MTKYKNRKGGFFGVGMYHPNRPVNVGGLWRTAHSMGARYLCTISAKKYLRESTDTSKAQYNLPLFHYSSVEDWVDNLPAHTIPIAVEITPDAVPLEDFVHPQHAVYLLGPENGSLPKRLLELCDQTVKISSCKFCLNVATAGSIVMYDRKVKLNEYNPKTTVIRS